MSSKASDSASAPEPEPEQVARSWNELQGAKLFRFLFDGGFQRIPTLTQTDVEQLAHRFAAAYRETDKDKHFSQAGQEAVDRIGLLKALALRTQTGRDREVRRALAGLYASILLQKDEHALVKRQALRNLNHVRDAFDERERQRILSRLDTSILSSAAISERELAEGLLEAAHN